MRTLYKFLIAGGVIGSVGILAFVGIKEYRKKLIRDRANSMIKDSQDITKKLIEETRQKEHIYPEIEYNNMPHTNTTEAAAIFLAKEDNIKETIKKGNTVEGFSKWLNLEKGKKKLPVPLDAEGAKKFEEAQALNRMLEYMDKGGKKNPKGSNTWEERINYADEYWSKSKEDRRSELQRYKADILLRMKSNNPETLVAASGEYLIAFNRSLNLEEII